MAGDLQGRSIVVPESRELDVFAGLIERQGATTIRCPLVSIHDAEDPAPIEAWLRRLAEGRCDDVVLFTGEGLRRLMGVARRAGIADEVVAGLGRARRIVRGPKPVKALREIGLAPDLSAEAPTTDGLVRTMAALDLAGRTIGLQAYPGQPDTLDLALARQGAAVDRVLPYRYASQEEDECVVALIDRMAGGGVDLIAFTSRPQVKRLCDVAEGSDRREALDRAMHRTRIAAIGPVCREAVESAGWRVAIEPEVNFHMRPMVQAITGLFEREGA